jgi:O-acetyl-ADP-ribose deacetylase (regulator of RNase III)
MTAAVQSPVGMKCEPVEKKVNETTIKLQQGDLTALEVDAWVFYAKENLEIGSGYGTAISSRGGLAIAKELEEIGSIKMGEAVITTAGEMNAKHVIHACGPKFQEKDLEQKLRDCMVSSLKVAVGNGVKTLAYPPMGTGFYGVPLDLSAKVMFEVITDFVKGDASLDKVIVCVIDYRDYVPFRTQLDQV